MNAVVLPLVTGIGAIILFCSASKRAGKDGVLLDAYGKVASDAIYALPLEQTVKLNFLERLKAVRSQGYYSVEWRKEKFDKIVGEAKRLAESPLPRDAK